MKLIAAFANSEGGMILIGVDDDGNVEGVSDTLIEEKIMNVCRNNCIPNIIPAFQSVEIDGKIIAIITKYLKELTNPIIQQTISTT